MFNPRLQLPTDTSWLRPSTPESDPGGVFDRVLGTDPAGPGGPFGLVSALSPRAGRVPRPVWDTAHEAREYWQNRPEVRTVRTVPTASVTWSSILMRASRRPSGGRTRGCPEASSSTCTASCRSPNRSRRRRWRA